MKNKVPFVSALNSEDTKRHVRVVSVNASVDFYSDSGWMKSGKPFVCNGKTM